MDAFRNNIIGNSRKLIEYNSSFASVDCGDELLYKDFLGRRRKALRKAHNNGTLSNQSDGSKSTTHLFKRPFQK